MNKEVEELAKAIFLKNNTERFFTNKTEQSVRTAADSAIEIAQMFYKVLEEKKNESKP